MCNLTDEERDLLKVMGFGWLLKMVVESTAYGRVRDDERNGWLPMLDYHMTIQEMDALQWEDLDYLPHVVDGGGSTEYMWRHTFP